MADEVRPLSDEERAELEALRAEKAARAARERAELEALRSERSSVQSTTPARRVNRRVEDEEDRRIREARERGAQLMEPDEDLRMPLGQKIVLGVLAALVTIVVVMTFLLG